MEDAIRALANANRREMLALVWDRERTAGEIAREAGLSAPATSQHLRVLREAGLVSVRAQANRRLYRAEPERVAGLRAALEAFWGQRLARMRDAAEESAGGADEPATAPAERPAGADEHASRSAERPAGAEGSR